MTPTARLFSRLKTGRLGAGWMVVASLLFGLMGVFVKLGAAHFTSIELVFYRTVLGMVIGALILGVVSSAAYGLLLRPEWQFILKAIVTFLAIIAQRYLLDRRNK